MHSAKSEVEIVTTAMRTTFRIRPVVPEVPLWTDPNTHSELAAQSLLNTLTRCARQTLSALLQFHSRSRRACLSFLPWPIHATRHPSIHATHRRTEKGTRTPRCCAHTCVCSMLCVSNALILHRTPCVRACALHRTRHWHKQPTTISTYPPTLPLGAHSARGDRDHPCAHVCTGSTEWLCVWVFRDGVGERMLVRTDACPPFRGV